MKTIKLSEFVNTYATTAKSKLADELEQIEIRLTTVDDFIDDIIEDDPLFNKYGVLYAMRDRLFLMSGEFVQKYVEYLYEFAMNNPHAVKRSFLYPYTMDTQSKNDAARKFTNPYYRNYETTITPEDAIAFYKEVMNSGIIQDCFDDAQKLSTGIKEISERHCGMNNPIFNNIFDSSIKRMRVIYGEDVNLNKWSNDGKNFIEKHKAVKSIINGDENEIVTHLAENLLSMFHMDKIESNRHRLKDYVFMSPTPNGFKNIFTSWDDFSNWCDYNSKSLRGVIKYYEALKANNFVNVTQITTMLDSREISLYMILKEQFLNYDKSMIIAGMTTEEINKNYNRQKLYGSVQSIIKTNIGETLND